MVINPLLAQYLWVLLWNTTALQCALGSALIVAPLWAFFVKPFLRRRCRPGPGGNGEAEAKAESKAKGKPESKAKGKPESKAKGKPESKGKAEGDGDGEGEGKADGEAAASPAAAPDALAELFRSAAFARWYRANEAPLRDRVRLRSAQRLWASLAVAALLLLGACALPLFSFTSGGATLLDLARTRCARGGATMGERVIGQAEALAIVTAGMALVTSAFMPPAAKGTASAALAAFAVLVAEAAAVERMGVGAGFAVLISVVAWRVASACE